MNVNLNNLNQIDNIIINNLDIIINFLDLNNNIINYQFFKNRMKNTFAEELMMNRFHPSNADKWVDWGFDF